MRVRTLLLGVCLGLTAAGCGTEQPTAAELHPSDRPAFDGGGWVGGGGRSSGTTGDTTMTAASAPGGGWIGGGGGLPNPDDTGTQP